MNKDLEEFDIAFSEMYVGGAIQYVRWRQFLRELSDLTTPEAVTLRRYMKTLTAVLKRATE
jgi:hypothetical protein